MEQIRQFFLHVLTIAKHHKKIAKLWGGNFNVFSILNLSTAEVRTHSALLAELLNPKGTHGQGDLFLRLFVGQLYPEGIIDTRSAVVTAEFYIGPINKEGTEGGRIDILIVDGDYNHIIIENKIDAEDQKYQLLRYYNYSKQLLLHHDDSKMGLLFYLTLPGIEPSILSTGGSLVKDDDYTCISYKDHVLEWLARCKKETVSLPFIRETIQQYENLVKLLTNQTTLETMQNELKELILANPKYIEAIEDSCRTLESMMAEAKKEFWAVCDEKFPGTKFELPDKSTIEVKLMEDRDGVTFAYSLMNGDERGTGSEQGKLYAEILKQIDSNFKSSGNYIGWFNPLPFVARKRFLESDKKTITMLLSDRTKMESFVDNLIEQEKTKRQYFIDRISA